MGSPPSALRGTGARDCQSNAAGRDCCSPFGNSRRPGRSGDKSGRGGPVGLGAPGPVRRAAGGRGGATAYGTTVRRISECRMLMADRAQLADLRTEVAVVFADALKIEVPSHDTDLLATGLLDSLGFVALLLELERRFGLRVAMEAIEPDNFRSVTNIAQFIASQRKVA